MAQTCVTESAIGDAGFASGEGSIAAVVGGAALDEAALDECRSAQESTVTNPIIEEDVVMEVKKAAVEAPEK